MKHLLTLKDEDVLPGAQNLPPDGWRTRTAARAVVFDEHNAVFLLKMSTYGYHKLPGGGVDDGETLEDALKRELLEEVGCPAQIEHELGEIIEFRNDETLEQHSYCLLARKSGDLVDTALEDSEIEEGAETVVATNIAEAIALLESDTPTNYEGHFIRLRDLRFLREAVRIVERS